MRAICHRFDGIFGKEVDQSVINGILETTIVGCLGHTELKLKWCTLLLDDEITEFLSLTDWKKRKNK